MIEIDVLMKVNWRVVYNLRTKKYWIRCKSASFVKDALAELCHMVERVEVVECGHGGDRHV